MHVQNLCLGGGGGPRPQAFVPPNVETMATPLVQSERYDVVTYFKNISCLHIASRKQIQTHKLYYPHITTREQDQTYKP